MMATLFLASSPLSAQEEGVRVLPDSLVVRSGPDAGYGVIGTVFKDQVYVSLEEADGYRRIWYNRSQGWIHGDYVELRSTSYDDVQRGTNVRSGPGNSYAKVGFAKSGSKWALIGTSATGNWHQIFYEGQQCWFYAKGRATTNEYVAPAAPVSILQDDAVRIIELQTTVRSGPADSYTTIGTVYEGQVYFSTEIFDGWRKIWYSRSEGWIPETDIVLQSAEYDVVDWDWLNVRTGPGLSYTQVTAVPGGSKWVSLAYSGSWHQIYFDGGTYWLSGVGVTTFDYVAPDGAAPSPTTSSVSFLKLPASGPGFVRRCGANNPDHAWGTPTAINGLIAAAEAWDLDHPDFPRVRMGDISLPDGGVFDDNGSSHMSHQDGVEIDIFLLRNDSSDDGAPDLYDPVYSSERTRDWIENYLSVALPEVETLGILLNDANIFSKLTTVSSTAVCPGEGCPLDASGEHIQPSVSGLSYVRCNPGHFCHMHARLATP